MSHDSKTRKSSLAGKDNETAIQLTSVDDMEVRDVHSYDFVDL